MYSQPGGSGAQEGRSGNQAAGQQPLFPKRRRIDHGDAQRQPSPGINRQSSVSFDLNLPGGPRRDPFRPRAKLEPDVSEHTIEPVRSSHPVPRPTPSAVSLEVNLPADRRDPLAPRRRQPEPRSGEDIPMMTPRKVQFRSPIRDDTPQHIREARQTLAMEGRSSVGVSRHDVAPFVLEGRVNAEDEDEEMQDPLASSPIRSFESTPSPQVTFDPKGPPIVVIQRSSPTRSRQGRQVEEREVGDMEIDELPDEGNVTKGKSPERAGEGVVAVTAAILVGAGEGRKPQVEGEEVIAETGTLGTEATDVKRGLRQERAEAQGEEQTREREAGIPDWLPPGERVDRPMDTNRTVTAGGSADYHLLAAQSAIRRDTARNTRLITRLLATRQLIDSAIESLRDSISKYALEGVELGQFN